MLRGLHSHCDKGNWDEARSILNTAYGRETASRPGGWGDWTPLHLACKRNPPVDVILALIDAASSAAQAFDSFHRLPVHYAAEKGSTREVLYSLYGAYPASICEVDVDGRTPLHLSITASRRELNPEKRRATPTRDEIELLVDDEGVVARTLDNLGNLPLHYVCDSLEDYSEDLLRVLVRKYVPAILEKNSEGLTPLHQALLKSVETPPTINHARILMAAGDVAQIEDDAGRLPLHCACQNFASYEVFEEILSRFVDACAIQTKDGKIPLEILESVRNEDMTEKELCDFNKKSDLLFANYPNVLPYRTQSDRLERYATKIFFDVERTNSLSISMQLIWVWLVTFPEESDPGNLYPSIVNNVLHSLSYNKARLLSSLTLPDGSLIHQHASQKSAELLRSYLRFADKYEFCKDLDVEKTDVSISIRALEFPDKDDFKRRKISPRTVVIKFMLNRAEFLRDTYIQSKIELSESDNHPIVPFFDSFDLTRIGEECEAIRDRAFARDIKVDSAYGLNRYCCALVRPETGESVESKLLQKKVKMEDIKKYLKQIGSALDCLHNNGISFSGIDTSSIVSVNGTLMFSNDNVANFIAEGYCGSKFTSGVMPPEMFVQLDAEGLKSYHRYWEHVCDDAKVAQTLLPNDVVLINERVNDFLFDNKNPAMWGFEVLWERMESNEYFWKKIRPRLVDGNYYVLKCFRIDERTGHPFSSASLPYDLVPLSESISSWMFAVLMFELCSGEPLLPVNRRKDLIDDDAFLKLLAWDIHSDYATKKLAIISDPLSRDLLRKILVHNEHRLGIAEALNHPFFSKREAGENRLAELSREIVMTEEENTRIRGQAKQRALEEGNMKVQVAKKRKEVEDWLRKHTTSMPIVTKGMRFRLDCSSWKQWQIVLPNDQESTCPQSFIILPYKLLLADDGFYTISEQDVKCAHRLGLLLGKILHCTSNANGIGQKSPLPEQANTAMLNKYSSMNRLASAYAETNVIDICQGIVSRAKNAEAILREIIDDAVQDRVSVAEKIVNDVLERYVNIDACKEVVSKANATGEAFALFLNNDDVGGVEKFSKQMVNEKYEAVLGSDFCSESISYKMDVEMALFGLIKDFTENPAAKSRQLLQDSIEELTKFFGESEKLFFYFIDEITGCPVRHCHPHEIEFYSLRFLLPCMRLSLKSMCATNVAFGLASQLGLKHEQIPQDWKKVLAESKGWFTNDVTINECDLFQGVVESVFTKSTRSYSVKDRHALFYRYEQFLLEQDPQRNYGGLHRLFLTSKQVLWSTCDVECEIKTDDDANLQKYEIQKVARAQRSLEKLLEANDKENQRDRENLEVSCGQPIGINIWNQDPCILQVNDYVRSLSSLSTFNSDGNMIPPVTNVPVPPKPCATMDSSDSSGCFRIVKETESKEDSNYFASPTLTQSISSYDENLKKSMRQTQQVLSTTFSSPLRRNKRTKSNCKIINEKGKNTDIDTMVYDDLSVYMQKLLSTKYASHSSTKADPESAKFSSDTGFSPAAKISKGFKLPPSPPPTSESTHQKEIFLSDSSEFLTAEPTVKQISSPVSASSNSFFECSDDDSSGNYNYSKRCASPMVRRVNDPESETLKEIPSSQILLKDDNLEKTIEAERIKNSAVSATKMAELLDNSLGEKKLLESPNFAGHKKAYRSYPGKKKFEGSRTITNLSPSSYDTGFTNAVNEDEEASGKKCLFAKRGVLLSPASNVLDSPTDSPTDSPKASPSGAQTVLLNSPKVKIMGDDSDLKNLNLKSRNKNMVLDSLIIKGMAVLETPSASSKARLTLTESSQSSISRQSSVSLNPRRNTSVYHDVLETPSVSSKARLTSTESTQSSVSREPNRTTRHEKPKMKKPEIFLSNHGKKTVRQPTSPFKIHVHPSPKSTTGNSPRHFNASPRNNIVKSRVPRAMKPKDESVKKETPTKETPTKKDFLLRFRQQMASTST